jgi:hypothetical protein
MGVSRSTILRDAKHSILKPLLLFSLCHNAFGLRAIDSLTEMIFIL